LGVDEKEPGGAFWPGCIAYFSRRNIVPLDRVIGSDRYLQKYLKKGKELEYLFENSGTYLAIYLNTSPKTLCAQKKYSIPHWVHLGETRLWEHCHWPFEAVSYRSLGPSGQGWYLIKFKNVTISEQDGRSVHVY
jgi:hypothetical protein